MAPAPESPMFSVVMQIQISQCSIDLNSIREVNSPRIINTFSLIFKVVNAVQTLVALEGENLRERKPERKAERKKER